MGCGERLIIGEGGVLWCASLLCPRPDAAAEILADGEAEHIVSWAGDGFTIRHPLRERLDDALLRCELHLHCGWLLGDGSGPEPGTYRVRGQGRVQWCWERLPT
jgi:hypothetical protein